MRPSPHPSASLSLLNPFAASVTPLVPPASRGVVQASDDTFPLRDTATDSATIVSTISAVNQKAGAEDGIPPNQPVPGTNVTALDGQVVLIPVSSIATSTITKSNTSEPPTRRLIVDGYRQVFAGSGERGTKVVDAAIEGTGYLTYTVVPNSTYNVDACLSYCSNVPGCGTFEILASDLPLLTSSACLSLR